MISGKSLFLALSLVLLTGCTGSKNNEVVQDITLGPMPKEENIPKVEINKPFKSLEKIEDLKAVHPYGKQDPFNFSSSSQLAINPSDFNLQGIISDQINKYALISYEGRTMELQEGDIGGEQKILLPKGLKVESIDLEKGVVILLFKETEIKLEMYPKSS